MEGLGGLLPSAACLPVRIARSTECSRSSRPCPCARITQCVGRRETPRGKRVLKGRPHSARRLATGDACMAFGINAEVLPHHANWRQFPGMVAIRFTRLRSESATSVADELLVSTT